MISRILRELKYLAQAMAYLSVGLILMFYFLFYLIPMVHHCIDQLRLFLGLITESELRWENLLTFP